MTVRTRFAPSPTGYLHLGGARTALYSWLYARKHQGTFILRIEDTDRERSTEASVQAIFEGMNWLGLDYDEGPFYQTKRMDRYKEVIDQLLNDGHAYHCYCSKEELEAMREAQMAAKQKPRYDRRCRDLNEPPADKCDVEPVIRFRNPDEGEVVFEDMVKGTIRVKNSELDDLIIARADGTPTYNLTVVVDDLDMGITHCIRGDDHVNNTPRQINILKALGAEPPRYAHLPMILGDDGARLSKRHGAMSVMQYKEDGFLPEALLNYLVRLGWSHGDQEIFSLQEMIELFDVCDVNRAASSFNTEKLLWINQQYIINSDPARVAEALQYQLDKLAIDTSHGPALTEVVNALKERARTLVEMAEGCRYFYQDFDSFDVKAAKNHLKQGAIAPLSLLKEKFSEQDQWQGHALHAIVEQVAEELELKMGKVGMPLRVAVTGGGQSPSIDVTLELIGKERVISRLQQAIDFIEAKIANQ